MEYITRIKINGERKEISPEEASEILKKQAARLDLLKAQAEFARMKSQTDNDDQIEDDGFLEALNGTAAEDWKNEETDI